LLEKKSRKLICFETGIGHESKLDLVHSGHSPGIGVAALSCGFQPFLGSLPGLAAWNRGSPTVNPVPVSFFSFQRDFDFRFMTLSLAVLRPGTQMSIDLRNLPA
jgi:hypothetical protein